MFTECLFCLNAGVCEGSRYTLDIKKLDILNKLEYMFQYSSYMLEYFCVTAKLDCIRTVSFVKSENVQNGTPTLSNEVLKNFANSINKISILRSSLKEHSATSFSPPFLLILFSANKSTADNFG